MILKILCEPGELEEMGLTPEQLEHALEDKLDDWYDQVTKVYEVVEEEWAVGD